MCHGQNKLRQIGKDVDGQDLPAHMQQLVMRQVMQVAI